MSKTFPLDEAQSLLPVLDALLRRAQEKGRVCAEIEVELDQLRQQIALTGGMHVDVTRAARRRATTGCRCQRYLGHLHSRIRQTVFGGRVLFWA